MTHSDDLDHSGPVAPGTDPDARLAAAATDDLADLDGSWASEGGAGPQGPATHAAGVPATEDTSPDKVSPGSAPTEGAAPEGAHGHGPATQAVGLMSPHELIDLASTDLTVAASEYDVRGCTVLDPDGHEIGTIDSLMVDATTCRVRMLVVGSGGFLGIGRHHRLVPTTAVTGVDRTAQQVGVDTQRTIWDRTPVYDPQLEQIPTQWAPDHPAEPHAMTTLPPDLARGLH